MFHPATTASASLAQDQPAAHTRTYVLRPGKRTTGEKISWFALSAASSGAKVHWGGAGW